ncbi:hypothetical protein [Owenweeksia hongkongensis]|uniref:hypothetical protein n=1 Tax=Owenweeksia hongkongensis TaxID=253245 RepID=UPI003A9164A4
MKLGNPWTFGILFMAVFSYLAWNNFELPTFLFGEVKETVGIVIVDTKKVATLPRGGFSQLIVFAYRIEDSTYIGRQTINPRKYSFRPIGSKLKLRYSKSDPTKFEVLSYYQFHSYSHKKEYLWQESFKGYDELYMENGIVKLQHKTEGGKLIDTFLGQSKTYKDTTLVVPIFKPFTPENTVICLVKSKSYKKETLQDKISKKSYWRATKS